MTALDRAVIEREPLAARLFDELRCATHDGIGITRASYGEGEQIAHDLIANAARLLGLQVSSDFAGNTFVDLPGKDPQAPIVVIGSHLDSVGQGGNFDGAAGVIAGLIALVALRDAGFTPARGVRVMAIRAEEGDWFGTSYIGSRSALGVLPAEALQTAKRVDTGRTLAAHMREAGFDPEAIRKGSASLAAENLFRFVEVHIEQGPVLETAGIPVGLVTGIRGLNRFPNARCVGEYSHCGGIPRAMRRDAVMAVCELMTKLEELWSQYESSGRDFAFTAGKFLTDSSRHGISKIPGTVDFTLDVRSVDGAVLDATDEDLARLANQIGQRRGVAFDFGERIHAEPGTISADLIHELQQGAESLAIEAISLASGASHDAAAFAAAGVPTAMLFVRNSNGSHNPDEAMALADFTDATRILAWWLAHKL